MNFQSDIVLENERVRLEPLGLQHLPELLPIAQQHPKLLQYSPSPFGSEDGLMQNIELAIKGRENRERYAFAIWDKQFNRYLGSTSFGSISPKDERLEIGWTWLDVAAQGTGLNKHCKFLLLRYAFEQLHYKRVEFKTDSRNLQSRRALEKIGAQYEGELRSHTVLLDGFRRTTAYYSILAEEWPEVKERCFWGFSR